MKETNTKWIKLLEAANSKYLNELSDGEIIGVKVSPSRKKWRLHIKLKNILRVNDIKIVMNEIKSYLISDANGIKGVDFIFTYENTDTTTEVLKEYYEEIIKECQTLKKSVCILPEYRYEILNNTLSIYVANDTDKRLVIDVLKIVKGRLDEYGLGFLETGVHISRFEVSLKDREEERRRLLEQTLETVSYENDLRREANNNSQNNRVDYRQRKSRVAISKKIKELPMTSMQVHEFVQINNTDCVQVEGVLVKGEVKKAGKYLLFEGIITDFEDSIIIKKFLRGNEEQIFREQMFPNTRIQIKGAVQYDTFARDVTIMIQDLTILGEDAADARFDEAEIKRVELHAHTKMSTLDSVLDIEDYIKTAVKFKHKALAVTDHGNCHAMPEFFAKAKKHGIKPIMGVEGYYVDDSNYRISLTDDSIPLNDATYVVYDFETTGLSSNFNEIIEIGAVKMKEGVILDRFSTFVKPKRKASALITDITGITNDDLRNAPSIEEVLPQFKAFVEGCILVAHNATFDNAFLYNELKKLNLYEKDYPTIDTLQLARVLYKERIKQFNLKAVAKTLRVEIDVQHRAVADAQTTTNVFLKMLGDLSDLGITNYQDINSLIDPNEAFKYVFPTHIILLVLNDQGRKNFNKIISDSHTTHFYKEPRVLKSVIEKYREGILVGSACANGEIFTTAFERSFDELLEKIDFYDYIEVQPPQAYWHLVEKSGEEVTKDFIIQTIKTIIKAAEMKNKMVVATGDVHYLDDKDKVYRQIYFNTARPGGGLHELAGIKNPPIMHFMTTTEMLQAFEFLGIDKAYEIVVTNTNIIADKVSEFNLFPDELIVPRDDFMAKYGIPSMSKALREKSYQTAHAIYGEELPQYIKDRLEVELKSIIGNGYSSVYYISHMLVNESLANGYIVGSRGSVGSSFVATMMGITEVNPLAPHYVCPKCHFSAFKITGESTEKYKMDIPTHIEEALSKVSVGYDLEGMDCPHCGSPLNRDGVDIPFETFLGFDGDKVPDIDLNFSGEYQDKAHLFCREVFGEDNAFRAGTIGTVAERTAFGFTRSYFESIGKDVRDAEIKRIVSKITGVKRTTGSHPGGIVVIPDFVEYTDIIPVQYPADDTTSSWRTSHYDYHSFESSLLKLDILGHDDPTMIKHLMDFVKAEPSLFPFSTVEEIPLSDKDVLALFNSINSLNIIDENYPEEVGTIGLPEFGTNFVREMLKDIRPKTVSDIIKISGLSHGTDVWLGNARDLVISTVPGSNPIPFSEIIGCRDDIMTYLLDKNLPAKQAFQIMESVRKGKGLTSAQEKLMIKHNVPSWYIESCKKIKYMFPKAHAVAYVIMALRIGWFKVHRPIYYYAAYFSRRATAFDVEVMAAGKNAIRNKLNEIRDKMDTGKASNKEIELYGELEIAYEMVLRGYSFKQIDIDKSQARHFIICEDKKSLLMPFMALDSLGEAAANSVVEARDERPFTSIKDVERRTKLNRTIMARLRHLEVFGDLPEDDQTGLF